ncbi:MAG: glycosyltransferase family 2 protein [Hydrococcus sp. Prado102]|jgi:glycosyltransferase involved in cell wall biosynthesis|nr:glycosyltransferase family 2 protein [Hydrococcus sp. Prado102]
MTGQTLEVLLPVKGRESLASTVASLLEINRVNLITIIAGDEQLVLPCLQTDSQRIRIIDLSEREFNKGAYLNAGIKAATGDILLVSDADILWNDETIMQLWFEAFFNCDLIVWVACVQESQPNERAINRPRFVPYLDRHPENRFTLRIESEKLSATRPGCGLICTRRQNLLALGGYNEELIGWGWEDRDLAIRAQLLGYRISSCGSVIHLSHSDSLRNQFCGREPLVTRNDNIIRSCRAIASGNLQGSLAPKAANNNKSYAIAIDLPDELKQGLVIGDWAIGKVE